MLQRYPVDWLLQGMPYAGVGAMRECTGLGVCEASAAYCPRRPDESVLHGVVAGNLETFLARQSERDRPVPRFVERELRSFLECGVLAYGFLRVHCAVCRRDRLVPYSCKSRAFCPSCGGRRMAETAVHLVDRVFPEVPVRQWVLSLPFSLRYRLAYDAPLVRDVLQTFVRAVFALVRRRAGLPAANRQARCGAVSFVQRFGDALNLNVLFHTLALDGIYAMDDEGKLAFRHAVPPSDADIARLAECVCRRVTRLLERRGLGPETGADDSDLLPRNQPLLAELYSASVSGRIAVGPRAGRRVAKAGDAVELEDLAIPNLRLCAAISGFSIHAGVCISARNRLRLERLCRYAARPPVATDRLSRLPDGRLLYRLRRRWRDGTSHVIFEPMDLLAGLAALVPPPRFNVVRYHGILAPAAALRSLIIPQLEPTDPVPRRDCLGKSRTSSGSAGDGTNKRKARPRNYRWAQLMRRVFDFDVLVCDRCGGRMRILDGTIPPEAVRRILDCLGLPSRPPPIASARLHMDEPQGDQRNIGSYHC